MDKLLKYAETIVWQAYPECKPDKTGIYRIKFPDGNCENHFYSTVSGWHNAVEPLWFADLPTGSIGDEFGFDTALLLMQEGEHCKALSDNPRFEYHFINEDGKLCVKDMDCIFIDEMLPLSVILGKWRLT